MHPQPFNDDSRLAILALGRDCDGSDCGLPEEACIERDEALLEAFEQSRKAVVDVALVDHGACATSTHCMLCPHAADHLDAEEHAGATASLVERLVAALSLIRPYVKREDELAQVGWGARRRSGCWLREGEVTR